MSIKSYPQADVSAEALDDFDTAVGDPAAYYPDPEAIVADTELSHSQKVRFLTEWSQDLVARQVADQEGMGRTDDIAGAEAALLRRIQECLEQLDGMTATEPEKPRGFWKRLLG